MKFSTKIEKAAAGKNDSRYYLRGVQIDSSKNRAVATNGHILAIIPFESECSGIVPLDAVTLSQKRNHGIAALDENVKVFNGSSTTEYSYVDGSFPDVDRVIPEKSAMVKSVTFNPQLLLDLALALTDKTHSKEPLVTLYLPDSASDAMRVDPVYGDPESIGVLMPASRPSK